MIPGLEERLLNGSEEEILHIADLVHFNVWVHIPSLILKYTIQIQKGSSHARSDDTKSLKGTILDWITPRGGALNPSLAHNVKVDRGFHHDQTGALLCPTNLNWSDNEYAM